MNFCRGPGQASAARAWRLDGNLLCTSVILSGRSGAAATSSWRCSVISGSGWDAGSSGKLSTPVRAALRQVDNCCGEIPCRRATCETTAPEAKDSATIRLLASSPQRRRRLTPSRISKRARGFEPPMMFSTIYANRPVQDGPHVAPQHDPNKVGKEGRLRFSRTMPAMRFWQTCIGFGHWTMAECLRLPKTWLG